MSRGLFVVALWALPGVPLAAANSRDDGRLPDRLRTVRAAVFLAEGEFADREGIGALVELELPVRQLGPGRLLFGPAAHYLFAQSQGGELGACETHHIDRIVGGGIRARYVADLNRVWRPWLAAGIGGDYTRHHFWHAGGCGTTSTSNEVAIGPTAHAAAGLDAKVSRRLTLTLSGTSHWGPRDFLAINVGAGWRF